MSANRKGNKVEVATINPAQVAPVVEQEEKAEEKAETLTSEEKAETLTPEEKAEKSARLAFIETELTRLKSSGRPSKDVIALRTERDSLKAALNIAPDATAEKAEKAEKSDAEIRAECEAFVNVAGALGVSGALDAFTVSGLLRRVLLLAAGMIEETSKRSRIEAAEEIRTRLMILRDGGGKGFKRYIVLIPGHKEPAYNGDSASGALEIIGKIEKLNAFSKEFGLPFSPDPTATDTITGANLTAAELSEIEKTRAAELSAAMAAAAEKAAETK